MLILFSIKKQMSNLKKCKGVFRAPLGNLIRTQIGCSTNQLPQTKLISLRHASSSTGGSGQFWKWMRRRIYGMVFIVGVTGGSLLLVCYVQYTLMYYLSPDYPLDSILD